MGTPINIFNRSDQQMEYLDLACAKMHEEPGIFKLLIIDSVMALYRFQLMSFTVNF